MISIQPSMPQGAQWLVKCPGYARGMPRRMLMFIFDWYINIQNLLRYRSSQMLQAFNSNSIRIKLFQLVSFVPFSHLCFFPLMCQWILHTGQLRWLKTVIFHNLWKIPAPLWSTLSILICKQFYFASSNTCTLLLLSTNCSTSRNKKNKTH